MVLLPPISLWQGLPPKSSLCRAGLGLLPQFFFFTKDNTGSNEVSANFFPFPLKMQTDSVDLDGTGRASEGLWWGNRVGREVQFLIIM